MVSTAVQQIVHDSAAIGQSVTHAIQVASAQTGVNFAYLLNKAQQESGGDPNAKASGSTATGLFQFTGQTWLKMVKAHGAQYGLGNYSDHIKTDSSGTAYVSDPVWKKAILALRKDPQLSAEMAGELDKENATTLKANVGGKIGPTELYLAHFLGAGGASDFISAMREDPSAKAADILPEAAASNNSVFYNANGAPRSVAQIYQHFAKKFDQAPSTSSGTMIASVTAPQPTVQSMAQAISQSMPSQATSSYAGMSSYVVADAAAARSAYAAPTTSGVNDPSSLFETMILAQMKMSDTPVASTLGAASAYNKKTAVPALASIV